jgi:uncharacterized protein (TIGR02246 family)
MTTRLLLLSTAALLSAASEARYEPANVAGASSVNRAAAPSDEDAIRGQVARWLQLIQSKNAEGIAKLYAEDGAVMPPNGPMGQGRAAIQQTWASMMSTPGFNLSFAPEQIVVSSSGDMALDRGTYRLTIAPSGKAQNDTGKYVVVWRKVDGEWKAAADIFNSDLPASGG